MAEFSLQRLKGLEEIEQGTLLNERRDKRREYRIVGALAVVMN